MIDTDSLKITTNSYIPGGAGILVCLLAHHTETDI